MMMSKATIANIEQGRHTIWSDAWLGQVKSELSIELRHAEGLYAKRVTAAHAAIVTEIERRRNEAATPAISPNQRTIEAAMNAADGGA